MLGKCIINLFVFNKVKVNEEVRKIVFLFFNFNIMLNIFNYCGLFLVVVVVVFFFCWVLFYI